MQTEANTLEKEHSLKHAQSWIVLVAALMFGLSISSFDALTMPIGVSLFCWLQLFRKLSLGQAFLFGLILNFVVFQWVPEVFSNYAEVSPGISFIFTLLVLSYQSLQLVILQFLINLFSKQYKCKQPQLLRLISLTTCWTVLALLFPSLLPWTLSTPFIDFSPLALLSRIGGPFFTDAVILLFFGGILFVISDLYKKRFSLAPIGIVLALTMLSAVNYFTAQSNLEKELETAESLAVSTVQANLVVGYDYSAPRVNARNARLQKLTAEALKAHPKTDLVVWTETAWGYVFWEDEKAIEKHGRRDPIPKHKKHLLFGHYTRIEPKAEREQAMKVRPVYYNSATLLNPEGELSSKYRKRQLFPFSEKAPLKFLEKYFEKSKYGMTVGNSNYTIKLLGHSIGVSICFEDVWPSVFREGVRQEDASLLITLTNGGWFERTIANQQHLNSARWRAVENGRFLLRATNEGPATLVDPWGRVKILTASQTETFSHVPELKLLNTKTLYSMWGNTIVWVLVSVGLVILLACRSFR